MSWNQKGGRVHYQVDPNRAIYVTTNQCTCKLKPVDTDSNGVRANGQKNWQTILLNYYKQIRRTFE